jgi:signal peptidase I
MNNEIKDNEVKEKKNSKSMIIGTILGILMLVLCIYITIKVIIGNVNNQPPSIFNLSISYVPTESMKPTIDPGDYVLYHGAKYDDAKVGDIIIYYSESNDKFIIHRVVGKVSNGELEDKISYDPSVTGLSYDDMIDEINYYYSVKTTPECQNYLITLGDNNISLDSEPITGDMFYGKFIMVVGIMSFLSGGINKNLIFFILIIIFVLMIGLQVWNVFIKQKTEKMKKENELKEKDLNKMREDLRKEMLEELRKENPNLNDTIEKVETNQKPEVHISTDEIDKK